MASFEKNKYYEKNLKNNSLLEKEKVESKAKPIIRKYCPKYVNIIVEDSFVVKFHKETGACKPEEYKIIL